MNIRTRILQYLEYKTISRYQFYKKIGVSNGFLDKDGAIGSDKCEKICYQYPDINLYWLILGVGPMLKDEIKHNISPENTIPEIDNNSVGIILDRYEALTVENAFLKKENAELKQSRGEPIDTNSYTENTPKLSTSIVAEPTHK